MRAEQAGRLSPFLPFKIRVRQVLLTNCVFSFFSFVLSRNNASRATLWLFFSSTLLIAALAALHLGYLALAGLYFTLLAILLLAALLLSSGKLTSQEKRQRRLLP